MTWQALRDLPQHCHEKPLDDLPALVPPTWNKTQYHANFAKIWRRAADELSDAQNITVIGYSLPESDAFFRDLLALGLEGATRLRAFTVADPDLKAAERFQALLGPDSKHRFKHVESKFDRFAADHFGRNS